MKEKFVGVMPPVTTPFAADGSLLYDSLESNLRHYLETSVSGFLLLGSNGEAPHLTDSEKIEVIRRADSLVPSDRHFLVGLGSALSKGNSGRRQNCP